MAGVEPRFQVYERVEPTNYVMSTNLKRRHLNASQRAAVAVEALPELEREARERKRATPSPMWN